jgi:hypothetical protein
MTRVDYRYHFPLPVYGVALLLDVAMVMFYLVLALQTAFGISDDILPKENFGYYLTGTFIFSVILAFCTYMLLTSRDTFIFDNSGNRYFDGYTFLGKDKGEWKKMEGGFSRIVFQTYEQSQTFNFMGISKNKVDETVYELRKVYDDQTYDCLVSTSDVKCLPATLKIGKQIADANGVKFFDYVKDKYRKQKIYI